MTEAATPRAMQLPGDCNQDGTLNVSDPVCLAGVLFLGRPAQFPCGDGARDSGNLGLLDWQPDGVVNIADVSAALQFLFSGGAGHPLGSSCQPIEGCSESVCSE